MAPITPVLSVRKRMYCPCTNGACDCSAASKPSNSLSVEPNYYCDRVNAPCPSWLTSLMSALDVVAIATSVVCTWKCEPQANYDASVTNVDVKIIEASDGNQDFPMEYLAKISIIHLMIYLTAWLLSKNANLPQNVNLSITVTSVTCYFLPLMMSITNNQ